MTWRMLPWMRSRVAIAVALPVLTCTAPALDIAIDTGARCNTVGVVVLDAAVLPGWTVHALVVLDPSGDEGWALATRPDARVVLQPLPGGAALDVTDLAAAGPLVLQPGPVPGEAWLSFDGPDGMRVWQLGSPAQGGVREAPDLSAFPSGDEVEWSRRLIFVGTAPHVLAVPDEGDAATLVLPLARLGRDTLQIEASWDINYWWMCDQDVDDDDSCIDTIYDPTVRLDLLGATQADGADTSVVLIARHAAATSETPDQPGLHLTSVDTLELRNAGPGRPPDAYQHRRVSWSDVVPLTVSPAYVAADELGLYVLAGVVAPEGVERPGLDNDELVSARHGNQWNADDDNWYQYADKRDRSMLLQVEGEVAFAKFIEGEWRVAPVVRTAAMTTVDESLIAGLPVPDGSVARGAGFGQFLIRPPQDPAMRVRLACVDAADEDE